MNKRIVTLTLAIFAALAAAHADTSYLLIQGQFGPGGSEETFKWTVNYASGSLITGQDLLNDVLGQPTADGTFDAFGSPFNKWSSTSAAGSASYIDFGFDPSSLTEPFPISFTLGGTAVTQNPSGSNGWSYYVAGGGGAFGSDDNGADYSNTGSWGFSNDGSYNRTLSNGSFDAWVFGSFADAPAVDGDDNSPLVANFVPEPASAGLLACGGLGLLARSRKRRG